MTTAADRRTPRADALRDALVARFVAHGFLDVSVGELAAEMRCSKSTLYAIAPSKEQLIVAVVREFFRRATDAVERAIEPLGPGPARIGGYLGAIAAELTPASPAFYADLDAFAPAGEIYRQNTESAARRVQGLVAETDPQADAAFVGAVAGVVMTAVHRGDLRSAFGVDDADAYRGLATLIVAGLEAGPPPDHHQPDSLPTKDHLP